MAENFEIKPIGIIFTPFTTKDETPIQGVFSSEETCKVEVFQEFADALKDIEGFSHIYLVYLFDRAGDIRLIRETFLDDSPHGIFASRHPCRPNGIGLTVVKLLGVNGRFLIVSGADILNETPLIDIKPYIPRFDSFPEAIEGWTKDKKLRKKPPGRE
jgi:tRNA (adenine37-N6)-methyltransferase